MYAFLLVFCIVGLIIMFLSEFNNWDWRTKGQKEREKEREARVVQCEAEQAALQSLHGKVRINHVDVELETIHESYTQDEIIREVNLLAYQTAMACVNQDKAGRGKKTDLCWHESANGHTWTVSWDTEAREKKASWSEARKLALQICPELAERLPHFSKFEPLKSYREEHIQKKARKKSAA